MRGGRFYIALALGLVMGGLAYAAEQAERTIRTELNSFMSKPITVKKIYREAWNHDNQGPTSTVKLLEYYQKNNPGFDEDMMAVISRGLELMKKMNYGMKEKDLLKKSSEIRKNPEKAVQELAENIRSEVTFEDILSIIELAEPAERMADKLYHDQSVGKVTYPVDVDAFK